MTTDELRTEDRVPSIWRNRDFLLVSGSGFVNETGDWLLAVALPVFVFTETGSGRATAALFVIQLAISVVLGPYGGSLADRWDLRRALIATNVLQALTLLPLLAATSDRIWPAFVVAAAQTTLQQVNDPASVALVPRVVPAAQLVPANAAFSAGSSLARLVGSPLGGLAIALGGLSTVVVVDAATFAVVALAMVFVRAPTASLVEREDPDAGSAGVRDGMRQIRHRPPLTAFVLIDALAQLAFAMFPVLFIVFVVEELDGGGTEVGVIRGMAAFGGIVASILVTRLFRRTDPTALMMWGYLGLGAVAAIFVNAPAVTTALWVYLVLFALTGLPNVTSQIGTRSTAQLLCPPQVLGRLAGLMSAAGAVGAAIGAVGVGLLIDHIDIIALFNAQAALYALGGVATYVTIVRHRRAEARGRR
jgi:predicted MFS family arabinose efflux permease